MYVGVEQELTLKIWIRRVEVELAGSVSGRGEQDVATFPPNLCERGPVYILAPCRRF